MGTCTVATKACYGASMQNTDTVTVETLQNKRIVRVGERMQLTQWADDGSQEPRISIDALSEKVERPSKEVRRIAREIAEKNENFKPLNRWVDPTGHAPGFTELWLKETEVLYLCTKLRGEVPERITWEMVEVYAKARRGLLPQQNSAELSVLKAIVESQGKQLAQLLSNVSPHGLLGPVKARELLDAIASSADLYYSRTRDRKSWTGCRKRLEVSVRKAGKWPQAGAVRDMSASGEADAWVRVKEIESDYISARKAEHTASTSVGRTKQMSLDIVKKN